MIIVENKRLKMIGIPDIKHTADCLERAIEIGQEYLNNEDACC